MGILIENKKKEEDMRPFNPITTDQLGGFSVGNTVEIQDMGKLYKSWPEAYSYFGFTDNVRSSSDDVDAYEVGVIEHLFVHPKYPDRDIAVVRWDYGGHGVVNTIALQNLVEEQSMTIPQPADDTIKDIIKDTKDKIDISFIHKKGSTPKHGELEILHERKVKL